MVIPKIAFVMLLLLGIAALAAVVLSVSIELTLLTILLYRSVASQYSKDDRVIIYKDRI